MACNCIRAIEAKLKEEYGEDFTMAYCLQRVGGVLISTWPGLTVRFLGTKRDGTPSLRWSRKTILPTYCPVCGERYTEESE